MNRIKELCVRRGIDQKQVALRIGVSQPTVSDWFNQKKNPRDERLEKLCDMLNVSESVIFGYESDPLLTEIKSEKETQSIAIRLKELREKSGKTQDTVADACGISRLTLSRYESGTNEPKASALASLAQYYNVPVDSLTECCSSNSEAIEQALLRGFRALPEDGKKEILEYLKFKSSKK